MTRPTRAVAPEGGDAKRPGESPVTADPEPASPLWLIPLLGLLALQAVLFRGFIPDDAFISFRVAEHLAHGDGLVYNLGERVEGYSNLLWVLILALCSRLGVEVIWAAKGLGVFFSAATLVLT